ncbi:MAG: M20/M25/M40 family metallo-hydrolase [Pyrinomonadaceae bacterium]
MKLAKPFSSIGIRNIALSITIVAACSYSQLPLAMLQQAKQPPEPFSAKTLAELRRIHQAGLESEYGYRVLAHLSDNIGPRLSGSPQADRAVEYVAEEMRRLGMEVQLEKLLVPHWVRGEETAELVEYPGQIPNTTQRIVLTALGASSATTQEGLTAELIVVSSLEQLQALGTEKVKGRIVLFNVPFDKQMASQGAGIEAYSQAAIYRRTGPSAAAGLGAVAVLIRSVGGADYRLPHTGLTFYAEGSRKIPAAAVAAEDADLIARLSSQGKLRLHLKLTPETLPDVVSYNVIGDLKGSEHPEQIVIVSGHLDSWDLGTGALDDAAGVVMALETVQLLRQLKLQPKRTIRVIAWMNEENGQVGAKTYAKNHVADIENHFAAIESDHGAGHPLGFDVTGDPAILPLLSQVSSLLQSSGAGLMRITECRVIDIVPLANAGVPAFGLWQDTRTYFNYHHTAADTLDKVDPRELRENSAAVAVLAYALASLPGQLPRTTSATPAKL